FDVRDDGGYLRIDTGALRLSYRLGSGSFTAENLAITYGTGSEQWTWQPGQPSAGNLGGTRRTLDDTGGDVPLEPGLVSRDGWVLFDDSLSVVFPAGDGWVSPRPPHSALDWYFFGYGHDYAAALADYTRFGGAVPLIPRYMLGIWWSRFWPYSDADLQQLVTEFADHRLPLDVLVVDMDWHTPGHWTGYTWNHELFPDPEAFLADMHRRGLRVTLNLHPADGVHPHEAAYDDFAAALNKDDADRTPIPFRITDHQFAESYFSLLHHPLEDQGVDFWWIDWQQGESTDIAGLDPLIWLNHLHFADARRRGKRPLLFSRWGGLGNHRYPLGFSGDTFGGWATLAALPRFTATAANVGFGWWSHDIGGHFGAAEPELFVRWVQFGALSPCLRLHATKDPLGERRPWAFAPPVLEAVRQAFDLRYRLIPYLYTVARRMHDDGSALCRPMYYAYPERTAAYDAHGQYLLGADLIAAPITQPADPQTGLALVDVWIPPGTWYRFDTGEAFNGPRWVRIAGDLAAMPLLVRAGAVVPLAQPALHLEDIPRDHLDITIFPGDDGTFRLYEDDGTTEAYLVGAYEWTTLTCTQRGKDERIVRIAPVEGQCATLPAQRSYTLTFTRTTPPEKV
ncbi:MAG TPA: TIM-barrel domain-containing protein, partial [Ktedonobacterales bacterium]|nr:TIM-barrel domain-containing protein [Ktedonobacterales bacterium]